MDGWRNPDVIKEDGVVTRCQVGSHKGQRMGRGRSDETGGVINITGSPWAIGFYHGTINRDIPRLTAMLIAAGPLRGRVSDGVICSRSKSGQNLRDASITLNKCRLNALRGIWI